MAKFLLSFIAVLVSVASIVGLYLAAAVIDLEWLFFVCVVVSIAIALGRKVWPSFREAVQQWRRYPSLQLELTKARARIHGMKQARDAAITAAQEARDMGVSEGRAQVIGAILAANVDPPPILAIAEYDGEVSLVVQSVTGLPLGARFRVVVLTTGLLRGTVQVAGVDPDRGVYFLTCVEPSMPEFWSALRDKLVVDTSPPHGVALEPFQVPPHLSGVLGLPVPTAPLPTPEVKQ